MIGPAQTNDPAATDWAPIAEAASGDSSAQERFCRRYLPHVRRWLAGRWRHGALQSLVGDGVQEVFLECCRPGGALSHADPARGGRFDAYLRGVVRNIAARIERREARNAARREHYQVRLRYLSAPAGGQLERLDWSRVRAAIREAVAELDSERTRSGHTLRELVHLLFEEGLAVREVAASWEETPERVHELRRRACRLLRRSLARAIGIGIDSLPPSTSVLELLAI